MSSYGIILPCPVYFEGSGFVFCCSFCSIFTCDGVLMFEADNGFPKEELFSLLFIKSKVVFDSIGVVNIIMISANSLFRLGEFAKLELKIKCVLYST